MGSLNVFLGSPVVTFVDEPSFGFENERIGIVIRVVMNGIYTGPNVAAAGKMIPIDSDATMFNLSERRAGDRRSHSHAFIDAGSEISAFVEEGTALDIGERGESPSDLFGNLLVGQRVVTEVEKTGR